MSPPEFAEYNRVNRLVLFGIFLDAAVLAFVVPLLSVLASGENIALHHYWGRLYKWLGLHDQQSFILILVVVLLILFLLKNILGIIINNKQAKLAHQIAGQLSQRMFGHYYSYNFQQLKENETTKLITRIMFVPSAFASGILLPYGIFISELLLMGIIIVGLALFKPYLFLLIALSLGPVMYIIYRVLKNRMHKMGIERNEVSTNAYDKLSEAFSGWQEAALLGKEKFFFNNYYYNQEKVNKNDAILFTYSTIPHRVIEVAALLGLVLIIISSMIAGFGTNRLLYYLGLYTAAAFRLIPSINRISSSLLKLKNYHYTVDELLPYSIINKNDDSPINNFENIELQNVSFAYNNSNVEVISNLNLQLNKGDIIGITGPSGCGKSTLLQVIAGIYKPTEGTILYNNKENTNGLLCHTVAIAKQDTFVYNGSLMENITLNHQSNDAEMQRAVKLIELLKLQDLSKELSNRSNMKAGEMGNRLSGGQKQRLSLARALYNKPQILLLDEATNALDKETEKDILNYLKELNKTEQLTMVLVSHHLEVLGIANKIIGVTSKE